MVKVLIKLLQFIQAKVTVLASMAFIIKLFSVDFFMNGQSVATGEVLTAKFASENYAYFVEALQVSVVASFNLVILFALFTCVYCSISYIDFFFLTT